MASQQAEVKHISLIDGNLTYLIENINAKGTLLWEKLIEYKVFLFEDAQNIQVRSKKG